jgi:hypothetical protein
MKEINIKQSSHTLTRELISSLYLVEELNFISKIYYFSVIRFTYIVKFPLNRLIERFNPNKQIYILEVLE